MTDVEVVVDNHHKERVEQCSGCWACMHSVGEGMHWVVAFHAVKAEVVVLVCVPFVRVEGDNSLDRLVDVVNIELQEDCHSRLRDLAVRLNRELTSIKTKCNFACKFL